MQQEGDGACLELYLASLLIVRQSSGHNMYGFNSSCSSAVGVAVGDGQLSMSGSPTNLGNGRAGLTVFAVGADGGCSDILSPTELYVGNLLRA